MGLGTIIEVYGRASIIYFSKWYLCNGRHLTIYFFTLKLNTQNLSLSDHGISSIPSYQDAPFVIPPGNSMLRDIL